MPAEIRELYCVELLTRHWGPMVDWYQQVLGLRGLVRIVEDEYALLAAGTARLAILGRSDAPPGPGRQRLIFEVDRLDDPAARIHPEGFRELALVDPDGNAVRLIAWP